MESIKSSSKSSKHSKVSDSKKKSKHRDRSPSEERDSSRRKYETNNNSDDENTKRSSSNKDEKSKKHRTERKSDQQSEQSVTSNSAGGDISLSIEETNKLREKLGLKPLTMSENKSTSKTNENNSKSGADGKKTYIDQDTNQEFEHVPAKNIAELKEQKSLREKLQEQREKRQLVEKLRKTKGLADSDHEEEASTWLLKVKQKEEALKKAKLLEEMDEQFGMNDDNELAEKKQKIINNKNKQQIKKATKNYNENDLKGLRVEHDQSLIKEGEEVILTLKDRNIIKGHGDFIELDEDDDADVLINVNIADDEKAIKNNENKKKRPDYQAYDDFDEDGIVCFLYFILF